MLDMTSRTEIVAAQVAGDFVLPKNRKRKLVFIAGGIGVTPFRSMVKYLIDQHEQRDIIMLYAAKDAQDIAYADVFEQARRELGIPTTYVLARPNPTQPLNAYQREGYIDGGVIRAAVPDYRGRMFYISGSHQMVVAIQDTLNNLGVPKSHIKVDYFPGYA